MYGQTAAHAYQAIEKTANTPRELEAFILTKAASRFQAILNNWEAEKQNLRTALQYNQKLWTIFVANATSPDSTLPLPLRNNITNLGIFVFKRTNELLTKPESKKLEILIFINRELSAGLRT
ncbi:MAG: flagellar biosynthesis regulator FlaF [Rhizobiales bacterium]|nr:flagellar biosynthesis regulator FlaF [Hyphomicrobiales bacterium]